MEGHLIVGIELFAPRPAAFSETANDPANESAVSAELMSLSEMIWYSISTPSDALPPPAAAAGSVLAFASVPFSPSRRRRPSVAAPSAGLAATRMIVTATCGAAPPASQTPPPARTWGARNAEAVPQLRRAVESMQRKGSASAKKGSGKHATQRQCLSYEGQWKACNAKAVP